MNGTSRRTQPAAGARNRSPDADAADDTLAARARTGDGVAFERLVYRYEARILNYLARWTGGDRHQAQDLTQEVFVKAHRGLARFRTGRSFSGWLFAIARRTAISHLRRQRRDDPGDPPETVDARDPSLLLGEREAKDNLWNLARRVLKEPQFSALWLHYAEDLSIRATAAAMQRSTVSVKVLLHRARRRLAQSLAPELLLATGGGAAADPPIRRDGREGEDAHDGMSMVPLDAGFPV